MPALVVALLLSLQRSATSPCVGVPAHAPGFTWHYSVMRLAGGRAGVARVSWAMSVVDTASAGRATLLLVRGFVTEVAPSEPPASPRLSILVCSAGSLSQFKGRSDEETRAAFAQWDDSLAIRSRVFLQAALYDGQVFGQDPPRQDVLYGWEVETLAKSPRLPRSCGTSSANAYRLTYRTNPDITVLDWLDGVGVARYTYDHHGSPGRVNARLVSCTRSRAMTPKLK